MGTAFALHSQFVLCTGRASRIDDQRVASSFGERPDRGCEIRALPEDPGKGASASVKMPQSEESIKEPPSPGVVPMPSIGSSRKWPDD